MRRPISPSWKPWSYLAPFQRQSALKVSLNDMRYINSRFTYLLTYYCRFLCSWLHPYSTLFLGYSCWTRSLMLGSIWAGILSYSAVKLFLKYSNLCEKHTWTSQADRQTDGRMIYCGITALCIASRGKNANDGSFDRIDWFCCGVALLLFLRNQDAQISAASLHFSLPLGVFFCPL